MMARNGWTHEEEEILYTLVKNNFELFSSLKEINTSNVKGIGKNISRTPLACLYKLQSFGILQSHPQTKSDGIFKVRSFSLRDLVTFKYFPKREIYPMDEACIQQIYDEQTSKGSTVKEVAIAISHEMNLSEVAAFYHLFKLGKIEYSPLTRYQFVDSEAISTQVQEIRNKEADPATIQQINECRSNIAGLYNGQDKNNPSIASSNDGTGFGKSYSVFDQYIKYATQTFQQGIHRNLLFLTPQKAQISIDDALVVDARKAGIEILSFKAIGDLVNLEFKDWITSETNIDRYKRIIKALGKSSYYKKSIGAFKNSIRSLEDTESSIRHEKNKSISDRDFEELDYLSKSLEKKRNRLNKSLEDLLKAVMNEGADKGATSSISERYLNLKADPNGTKNQAIVEIIDIVAPFERAKVTPTIIVCTTDKFNTTTYSVRKSKTKKEGYNSFVLDHVKLHNYVGCKIAEKELKDVDYADIVSKSFDDQLGDIKNDILKLDEENCFYKSGIQFTVVIDEEHEAYNRFTNNRKKNLVDEHTALMHVFSVTYRIFNDYYSTVNPEELDFYETIQDFVRDLRGLIENKCNLSVDWDLIDIFELFKDNYKHIYINSNDAEQIISICKNVFSYAPQHYFNENRLKKIKLRTTRSGSAAELYYDNELEDNNLTLHDIIQVTMCILYACSKIEDMNFRRMIDLFSDSSQNSLFERFIRKAVSNKEHLHAMFERVSDKDMDVEYFYTYFTSKIIFSIERIEVLDYWDSKMANKIFVSFRLDLFKNLPEVELIKMLYNTQNTAILLSATSGFHEILDGNYSRAFIRDFGDKANLDIQYIERSDTDSANIQALREQRATLRHVDVNTFHDEKFINACPSDKFQRAYKQLNQKLREHMGGPVALNAYQNLEFERNLIALLFAAYDGKNSIILSLSHRFINALKAFVGEIQTGGNIRLTDFTMNETETGQIFEFRPFADKPKLRVVLYNADLDKQVDVLKYLSLEDLDTKIALCSSYKAAGTGLNLFVNYPNAGSKPGKSIEEDFERLVLTNTPFYSNVKKDSGLNNTDNFILLLRYFSQKNDIKKLSDFDTNILGGLNYKVLMNEHKMSLLKIIMQAIGRVERRDTHMLTEIFIPEDIVEDMSIQFRKVAEIPENKKIIANMSLLNYRFYERTQAYIAQHSFESKEARDRFVDEAKFTHDTINDYFKSEIRGRYLKHARIEGHTDQENGIILNDALRSIKSVTAPEEYIAELMALPVVQNDTYHQEVINRFFINSNDTPAKVCVDQDFNLTDLSQAESIYRPYDIILPYYSSPDIDVKGSGQSIIQSIDTRQLNTEMIPNPALIPLLKGNVGEYLFKQTLEKFEICELSSESVVALAPELYELFDYYFIVNDTLISVDVKNWSSNRDMSYLGYSVLKKAIKKIRTIRSVLAHTDLDFHFVYLNAHIDQNALNYGKEMGNKHSLSFMNLFKVNEFYRELKGIRGAGNNKYSKIAKRIDVNKRLVTLLRGE